MAVGVTRVQARYVSKYTWLQQNTTAPYVTGRSGKTTMS
jgi:hypothetical protein